MKTPDMPYLTVEPADWEPMPDDKAQQLSADVLGYADDQLDLALSRAYPARLNPADVHRGLVVRALGDSGLTLQKAHPYDGRYTEESMGILIDSLLHPRSL